MASEIELNIGNKGYKLAVDDGQEARLRSVAQSFDSFVRKMQQSSPTMDRDRVLVLSSLMMADSFLSLQQEKETQEQSFEAFQNSLAEKLEKMTAKLVVDK